jgi:hypothetical protein
MFQLNATMARAINELAFQGKEQRSEERKKTSLLSSWTLRARDLFRLYLLLEFDSIESIPP